MHFLTYNSEKLKEGEGYDWEQNEFKNILYKKDIQWDIQNIYDLNDDTIIIPPNFIIKFDDGKITNGTIIFNDTKIEGNALFENCYLNGKIRTNDAISDESFIGDSNYDNNILSFLIDNCAYNNTTLELHRDYTIKYDDCVNIPFVGRCFSRVYDNEGFVINGNGHTIYETINSVIGGYNHFFIYLERCNNVKVTGVKYHCDYAEGYLDSYDKKESGGPTIIYTAGDCGNCYFDLYGHRVSTIVRAGAFGNDYERNEDGSIKTDEEGTPIIEYGNPTPNHVHKGLHDTKLILGGYHVGYTVAVYTGENLDVVSYFDGAHRGVYLTGVSNAKVVAKGKNIRTPVIVLLGESVYYESDDVNFVHPRFKPCSNIECDITDTGSRKIKEDDAGYENWPNNVYTTGLHIRPYGKNPSTAYHFSKRDYAHHFSNIRCTIRRENITEESTQLTAVVVSDLVKSLGDTCSVEVFDSVLDAVPSTDSETGEVSMLPFNLINVGSQAETDESGNSVDDKTVVNVRMNRVIATEANCTMNSPFNVDFTASEIKTFVIKEYEKENTLSLKRAKIKSISTNSKKVKTKIQY